MKNYRTGRKARQIHIQCIQFFRRKSHMIQVQVVHTNVDKNVCMAGTVECANIEPQTIRFWWLVISRIAMLIQEF